LFEYSLNYDIESLWLLGFFFNDSAPTEIYTLSLHDALPISGDMVQQGPVSARQVAEHCEGSGVRLDMSYLVAGGTILASRQWVGPALGYVAIQQLRN